MITHKSLTNKVLMRSTFTSRNNLPQGVHTFTGNQHQQRLVLKNGNFTPRRNLGSIDGALPIFKSTTSLKKQFPLAPQTSTQNFLRKSNQFFPIAGSHQRLLSPSLTKNSLLPLSATKTAQNSPPQESEFVKQLSTQLKPMKKKKLMKVT